MLLSVPDVMSNKFAGHNHLSSPRDLNDIKGIKLLTLNARSLLPKIDILRVDFNNVDIDILCITESWLKPTVNDALLGLKDLKFVRLDHTTLNYNGDLKSGGGIICYYKPRFLCSIINDATYCSSDTEILAIKHCKENQVNTIVLCVYRPPSGSLSSPLDKIKDVCDKMCTDKNNRDIYLLGDLNLNLLVKNSFTISG